ncbi:MAG: serine/threonine protein kinase [Gammaproteobacteria bacterium]|nr:serine/threonine protein kinase [Gammaproteobacteria bacterium]
MSNSEKLLKRDLLGEVRLLQQPGGEWLSRRDAGAARWWLRPIARRLAARENRALQLLTAIDGVPRSLSASHSTLDREWLAGAPMQEAGPRDKAYYREALRLLRQIHRAGVVHNDTAKEPNWLVRTDGSPALIDFQVAMCFRQRGRLFRMLAREDVRHLLKHKRTYLSAGLTSRQKKMLATPAISARLWRISGKPLYLWVTRRLLGWSDREGADDRRPAG